MLNGSLEEVGKLGSAANGLLHLGFRERDQGLIHGSIGGRPSKGHVDRPSAFRAIAILAHATR